MTETDHDTRTEWSALGVRRDRDADARHHRKNYFTAVTGAHGPAAFTAERTGRLHLRVVR